MKIVMRNTDTVTGLFFFCLSLVLLWQTRQFATSMETVRAIGPQVFPNAIAGTMCVLSLLLFAQGMRKPVVSLWVGGDFRGTLACSPQLPFVRLVSFFYWNTSGLPSGCSAFSS